MILLFSLKNDYKFIWINEDNILDFVDESLFEGENQKQYEAMQRGLPKNKNTIH